MPLHKLAKDADSGTNGCPTVYAIDELPEDLFDSSVLYLMHYGADGTWLGAEHVTDPARIVEACRWRDAALYRATPWRTYVASHPDLKRYLAQ